MTMCGVDQAPNRWTVFRSVVAIRSVANLRRRPWQGAPAGPPAACGAHLVGVLREVRAAVRDLGVERVGHGVRAIEDLALVDELAEKGVVLECCPGSNVALGIYPSFRAQPIAELDRRGVKVTINTDDPPFFHTTMAREYDELHRAFDWDEGQFRRLAVQALDAAFCDVDTKAKIAKLLEP
jgi:adenosine deaminase